MFLLVASVTAVSGWELSRTFCDCKTALNDGTLNETNANSLLSALASLMHCNGVRVPLLPENSSPMQYSVGYNATIVAARALNLTLYASPMEGAWKSFSGEKEYASWVMQYAAAYGPHFLSAFNEVGESNCNPGCMGRVVSSVRGTPGVPSYIRYVGPDEEHVASTLKACSSSGNFKGVFDVLSSHNAGGDTTATSAAWKELVRAGGASRDVWSSENPACFTLPACTQYSNLSTPLDSGVNGLVTWATLGNDVTLAGSITAQGSDIAAGLMRGGR